MRGCFFFLQKEVKSKMGIERIMMRETTGGGLACISNEFGICFLHFRILHLASCMSILHNLDFLTL